MTISVESFKTLFTEIIYRNFPKFSEIFPKKKKKNLPKFSVIW